MNQKQSKEFDKLTSDIEDFIVKSSVDLVMAEAEEDYEKCQLIAVNLQLFLFNRAQMLQEIRPEKSSSEILLILKTVAAEILIKIRKQKEAEEKS